MSITLEVDGLTPLVRAIAEMPDALTRATHDASMDALELVRRELATYPPQRTPRQKRKAYQRTGTLGRGWQITAPFAASASAFVAAIGNAVPYAGYVQGGIDDAPGQAWMHAGTWQTTDAAVARQQDAIDALFEEAVDGAIQPLVGGA